MVWSGGWVMNVSSSSGKSGTYAEEQMRLKRGGVEERLKAIQGVF